MISIEFYGFAKDGVEMVGEDVAGYFARDYLPGFLNMEFATKDEAEAWITANHAGPDIDGVDAIFIPVG